MNSNPGVSPKFARHVCLLRGINVGGNARVSMAQLRLSVEACGTTHIRTYINSGNVLFTDVSARSVTQLEQTLSARLLQDFGFPIALVVIPAPRFAAIAGAIPAHWANDSEQKADAVFLLPELDTPGVLARFPVRPVDDVIHVPGALLWRVTRADQTRTGLLQVVGTPLYRQITVRNINTVRKLAALLDA